MIRNVLIALAACYPIGVGVLGVLKLNVPLCANVPWPEVLYGPAFTLASAFGMFLTVYFIVCRVRR